MICCDEFTELESMRLSVEMPGLLVAGPGGATLDHITAAARGLNINTSQVSGKSKPILERNIS